MKILETRETEVQTFEELREIYERRSRVWSFCGGLAIGLLLLMFGAIGLVEQQKENADTISTAIEEACPRR